MIGKPIQLMLELEELLECRGTDLSLNSFPTLTTASSKFHDEAASATPAPKSSKEGINERRNRIVEVVLCEFKESWSSSRVLSSKGVL